MTTWHVLHGDILDVEAEGLICSANPQLNLSGGVGGAFLLRYGDEMQMFLHEYLRPRDLKYISPGHCVLAPPCGSSFKAVSHAVSIDVFYDTSVPLILKTYDEAIHSLANRNCSTIAAACLGCGYGRLSSADFSTVATKLLTLNFKGVERITFVTTNSDLADSIQSALANARR